MASDASGLPWPELILLPLESGVDVPNNVRLPAILYLSVLPDEPGEALAAAFEARFALNGWPARWRNGIYDFDHYHTRGHEVLGIASGSADIQIGGERGRPVRVHAGDAVLLPAGCGHRLLSAEGDLLVVGGYPPGQSGDICREPPTLAIRQRIAQLSFPASDPLLGRDGPLQRHWSGA